MSGNQGGNDGVGEGESERGDGIILESGTNP